MSEKMLRVKRIKSIIREKRGAKATIDALGLRKINYVKEFKDNPALRGMLFKVKHLVVIEEINQD